MRLSGGEKQVLGFVGSALLANANASGCDSDQKIKGLAIAQIFSIFFFVVKPARTSDIIILNLGLVLGLIASSDKSDESSNMELFRCVQVISGLVTVGIFLSR